MEEYKGTKGNWEVDKRASLRVHINGLTVASTSSGQSGENLEVEAFNAELIAEAGNVRQTIPFSLTELKRRYHKPTTLKLEGKEVEFFKWLLLKGMEITNSDNKHGVFDKYYDQLDNFTKQSLINKP